MKMGIRMGLAQIIMRKPEKKPRTPRKMTVMLRKTAKMRKKTEKEEEAKGKTKGKKMTRKQETPREAHEPTQPDQNRKIKVQRRGLEEQAGDADKFFSSHLLQFMNLIPCDRGAAFSSDFVRYVMYLTVLL